MNKKLHILLFSIALTFNESSYARLAGAEGTFKNIDSAINQAVEKAESLFEEFHGQNLKSRHKLAKNNPYLRLLKIKRNYTIAIKFARKEKKSENSSNEVPVAKGLRGSEIILIPVFNQGDEKITAWECLTNADRRIKEFLGSTGTKNFTASLIREYTENQYLSLCTFVNKKSLIRNHSGGGDIDSSNDEFDESNEFDENEADFGDDSNDDFLDEDNIEFDDNNNFPEAEPEESEEGFSFNPFNWFR